MRTPSRDLTYREPDYDDTVCVSCGADLPEDIKAYSWNDHGFCGYACAVRFNHPFDLLGTEIVLELARTGNGKGPGFEESVLRPIIEEWRKGKGLMLRLTKRRSEDDATARHAESAAAPTLAAGSWAWRIYLVGPGSATNRCVEFRLTAREDL